MIYVNREIDGKYAVSYDINGSLAHITKNKHRLRLYAVRDAVLLIRMLDKEGHNLSMAVINKYNQWNIFGLINGNLTLIK